MKRKNITRLSMAIILLVILSLSLFSACNNLTPDDTKFIPPENPVAEPNEPSVTPGPELTKHKLRNDEAMGMVIDSMKRSQQLNKMDANILEFEYEIFLDLNEKQVEQLYAIQVKGAIDLESNDKSKLQIEIVSQRDEDGKRVKDKLICGFYAVDGAIYIDTRGAAKPEGIHVFKSENMDLPWLAKTIQDLFDRLKLGEFMENFHISDLLAGVDLGAAGAIVGGIIGGNVPQVITNIIDKNGSYYVENGGGLETVIMPTILNDAKLMSMVFGLLGGVLNDDIQEVVELIFGWDVATIFSSASNGDIGLGLFFRAQIQDGCFEKFSIGIAVEDENPLDIDVGVKDIVLGKTPSFEMPDFTNVETESYSFTTLNLDLEVNLKIGETAKPYTLAGIDAAFGNLISGLLAGEGNSLSFVDADGNPIGLGAKEIDISSPVAIKLRVKLRAEIDLKNNNNTKILLEIIGEGEKVRAGVYYIGREQAAYIDLGGMGSGRYKIDTYPRRQYIKDVNGNIVQRERFVEDAKGKYIEKDGEYVTFKREPAAGTTKYKRELYYDLYNSATDAGMQRYRTEDSDEPLNLTTIIKDSLTELIPTIPSLTDIVAGAMSDGGKVSADEDDVFNEGEYIADLLNSGKVLIEHYNSAAATAEEVTNEIDAIAIIKMILLDAEIKRGEHKMSFDGIFISLGEDVINCLFSAIQPGLTLPITKLDVTIDSSSGPGVDGIIIEAALGDKGAPEGSPDREKVALEVKVLPEYGQSIDDYTMPDVNDPLRPYAKINVGFDQIGNLTGLSTINVAASGQIRLQLSQGEWNLSPLQEMMMGLILQLEVEEDIDMWYGFNISANLNLATIGNDTLNSIDAKIEITKNPETNKEASIVVYLIKGMLYVDAEAIGVPKIALNLSDIIDGDVNILGNVSGDSLATAEPEEKSIDVVGLIAGILGGVELDGRDGISLEVTLATNLLSALIGALVPDVTPEEIIVLDAVKVEEGSGIKLTLDGLNLSELELNVNAGFATDEERIDLGLGLGHIFIGLGENDIAPTDMTEYVDILSSLQIYLGADASLSVEVAEGKIDLNNMIGALLVDMASGAKFNPYIDVEEDILAGLDLSVKASLDLLNAPEYNNTQIVIKARGFRSKKLIFGAYYENGKLYADLTAIGFEKFCMDIDLMQLIADAAAEKEIDEPTALVTAEGDQTKPIDLAGLKIGLLIGKNGLQAKVLAGLTGLIVSLISDSVTGGDTSDDWMLAILGSEGMPGFDLPEIGATVDIDLGKDAGKPLLNGISVSVVVDAAKEVGDDPTMKLNIFLGNIELDTKLHNIIADDNDFEKSQFPSCGLLDNVFLEVVGALELGAYEADPEITNYSLKDYLTAFANEFAPKNKVDESGNPVLDESGNPIIEDNTALYNMLCAIMLKFNVASELHDIIGFRIAGNLALDSLLTEGKNMMPKLPILIEGSELAVELYNGAVGKSDCIIGIYLTGGYIYVHLNGNILASSKLKLNVAGLDLLSSLNYVLETDATAEDFSFAEGYVAGGYNTYVKKGEKYYPVTATNAEAYKNVKKYIKAGDKYVAEKEAIPEQIKEADGYVAPQATKFVKDGTDGYVALTAANAEKYADAVKYPRYIKIIIGQNVEANGSAAATAEPAGGTDIRSIGALISGLVRNITISNHSIGVNLGANLLGGILGMVLHISDVNIPVLNEENSFIKWDYGNPEIYGAGVKALQIGLGIDPVYLRLSLGGFRFGMTKGDVIPADLLDDIAYDADPANADKRYTSLLDLSNMSVSAEIGLDLELKEGVIPVGGILSALDPLLNLGLQLNSGVLDINVKDNIKYNLRIYAKANLNVTDFNRSQILLEIMNEPAGEVGHKVLGVYFDGMVKNPEFGVNADAPEFIPVLYFDSDVLNVAKFKLENFDLLGELLQGELDGIFGADGQLRTLLAGGASAAAEMSEAEVIDVLFSLSAHNIKLVLTESIIVGLLKALAPEIANNEIVMQIINDLRAQASVEISTVPFKVAVDLDTQYLALGVKVAEPRVSIDPIDDIFVSALANRDQYVSFEDKCLSVELALALQYKFFKHDKNNAIELTSVLDDLANNLDGKEYVEISAATAEQKIGAQGVRFNKYAKGVADEYTRNDNANPAYIKTVNPDGTWIYVKASDATAEQTVAAEGFEFYTYVKKADGSYAQTTAYSPDGNYLLIPDTLTLVRNLLKAIDLQVQLPDSEGEIRLNVVANLLMDELYKQIKLQNEVPVCGEDGNWWIYGKNTGVAYKAGVTPVVGDGFWWIGGIPTDVPYDKTDVLEKGSNGNWFIKHTDAVTKEEQVYDTGIVYVEGDKGTDGNGNWYIEGKDIGIAKRSLDILHCLDAGVFVSFDNGAKQIVISLKGGTLYFDLEDIGARNFQIGLIELIDKINGAGSANAVSAMSVGEGAAVAAGVDVSAILNNAIADITIAKGFGLDITINHKVLVAVFDSLLPGIFGEDTLKHFELVDEATDDSAYKPVADAVNYDVKDNRDYVKVGGKYELYDSKNSAHDGLDLYKKVRHSGVTYRKHNTATGGKAALFVGVAFANGFDFGLIIDGYSIGAERKSVLKKNRKESDFVAVDEGTNGKLTVETTVYLEFEGKNAKTVELGGLIYSIMNQVHLQKIEQGTYKDGDVNLQELGEALQTVSPVIDIAKFYNKLAINVKAALVLDELIGGKGFLDKVKNSEFAIQIQSVNEDGTLADVVLGLYLADGRLYIERRDTDPEVIYIDLSQFFVKETLSGEGAAVSDSERNAAVAEASALGEGITKGKMNLVLNTNGLNIEVTTELIEAILSALAGVDIELANTIGNLSATVGLTWADEGEKAVDLSKINVAVGVNIAELGLEIGIDGLNVGIIKEGETVIPNGAEAKHDIRREAVPVDTLTLDIGMKVGVGINIPDDIKIQDVLDMFNVNFNIGDLSVGVPRDELDNPIGAHIELIIDIAAGLNFGDLDKTEAVIKIQAKLGNSSTDIVSIYFNNGEIYADLTNLFGSTAKAKITGLQLSKLIGANSLFDLIGASASATAEEHGATVGFDGSSIKVIAAEALFKALFGALLPDSIAGNLPLSAILEVQYLNNEGKLDIEINLNATLEKLLGVDVRIYDINLDFRAGEAPFVSKPTDAESYPVAIVLGMVEKTDETGKTTHEFGIADIPVKSVSLGLTLSINSLLQGGTASPDKGTPAENEILITDLLQAFMTGATNLYGGMFLYDENGNAVHEMAREMALEINAEVNLRELIDIITSGKVSERLGDVLKSIDASVELVKNVNVTSSGGTVSSQEKDVLLGIYLEDGNAWVYLEGLGMANIAIGHEFIMEILSGTGVVASDGNALSAGDEETGGIDVAKLLGGIVESITLANKALEIVLVDNFLDPLLKTLLPDSEFVQGLTLPHYGAFAKGSRIALDLGAFTDRTKGLLAVDLQFYGLNVGIDLMAPSIGFNDATTETGVKSHPTVVENEWVEFGAGTNKLSVELALSLSIGLTGNGERPNGTRLGDILGGIMGDMDTALILDHDVIIDAGIKASAELTFNLTNKEFGITQLDLAVRLTRRNDTPSTDDDDLLVGIYYSDANDTIFLDASHFFADAQNNEFVNDTATGKLAVSGVSLIDLMFPKNGATASDANALVAGAEAAAETSPEQTASLISAAAAWAEFGPDTMLVTVTLKLVEEILKVALPDTDLEGMLPNAAVRVEAGVNPLKFLLNVDILDSGYQDVLGVQIGLYGFDHDEHGGEKYSDLAVHKEYISVLNGIDTEIRDGNFRHFATLDIPLLQAGDVENGIKFTNNVINVSLAVQLGFDAQQLQNGEARNWSKYLAGIFGLPENEFDILIDILGFKDGASNTDIKITIDAAVNLPNIIDGFNLAGTEVRVTIETLSDIFASELHPNGEYGKLIITLVGDGGNGMSDIYIDISNYRHKGKHKLSLDLMNLIGGASSGALANADTGILGDQVFNALNGIIASVEFVDGKLAVNLKEDTLAGLFALLLPDQDLGNTPLMGGGVFIDFTNLHIGANLDFYEKAADGTPTTETMRISIGIGYISLNTPDGYVNGTFVPVDDRENYKDLKELVIDIDLLGELSYTGVKSSSAMPPIDLSELFRLIKIKGQPLLENPLFQLRIANDMGTTYIINTHVHLNLQDFNDLKISLEVWDTADPDNHKIMIGAYVDGYDVYVDLSSLGIPKIKLAGVNLGAMIEGALGGLSGGLASDSAAPISYNAMSTSADEGGYGDRLLSGHGLAYIALVFRPELFAIGVNAMMIDKIVKLATHDTSDEPFLPNFGDIAILGDSRTFFIPEDEASEAEKQNIPDRYSAVEVTAANAAVYSGNTKYNKLLDETLPTGYNFVVREFAPENGVYETNADGTKKEFVLVPWESGVKYIKIGGKILPELAIRVSEGFYGNIKVNDIHINGNIKDGRTVNNDYVNWETAQSVFDRIGIDGTDWNTAYNLVTGEIGLSTVNLGVDIGMHFLTSDNKYGDPKYAQSFQFYMSNLLSSLLGTHSSEELGTEEKPYINDGSFVLRTPSDVIGYVVKLKVSTDISKLITPAGFNIAGLLESQILLEVHVDGNFTNTLILGVYKQANDDAFYLDLKQLGLPKIKLFGLGSLLSGLSAAASDMFASATAAADTTAAPAFGEIALENGRLEVALEMEVIRQLLKSLGVETEELYFKQGTSLAHYTSIVVRNPDDTVGMKIPLPNLGIIRLSLDIAGKINEVRLEIGLDEVGTMMDLAINNFELSTKAGYFTTEFDKLNGDYADDWGAIMLTDINGLSVKNIVVGALDAVDLDLSIKLNKKISSKTTDLLGNKSGTGGIAGVVFSPSYTTIRISRTNGDSSRFDGQNSGGEAVYGGKIAVNLDMENNGNKRHVAIWLFNNAIYGDLGEVAGILGGIGAVKKLKFADLDIASLIASDGGASASSEALVADTDEEYPLIASGLAAAAEGQPDVMSMIKGFIKGIKINWWYNTSVINTGSTQGIYGSTDISTIRVDLAPDGMNDLLCTLYYLLFGLYKSGSIDNLDINNIPALTANGYVSMARFQTLSTAAKMQIVKKDDGQTTSGLPDSSENGLKCTDAYRASPYYIQAFAGDLISSLVSGALRPMVVDNSGVGRVLCEIITSLLPIPLLAENRPSYLEIVLDKKNPNGMLREIGIHINAEHYSVSGNRISKLGVNDVSVDMDTGNAEILIQLNGVFFRSVSEVNWYNDTERQQAERLGLTGRDPIDNCYLGTREYLVADAFNPVELTSAALSSPTVLPQRVDATFTDYDGFKYNYTSKGDKGVMGGSDSEAKAWAELGGTSILWDVSRVNLTPGSTDSFIYGYAMNKLVAKVPVRVGTATGYQKVAGYASGTPSANGRMNLTLTDKIIVNSEPSSLTDGSVNSLPSTILIQNNNGEYALLSEKFNANGSWASVDNKIVPQAAYEKSNDPSDGEGVNDPKYWLFKQAAPVMVDLSGWNSGGGNVYTQFEQNTNKQYEIDSPRVGEYTYSEEGVYVGSGTYTPVSGSDAIFQMSAYTLDADGNRVHTPAATPYVEYNGKRLHAQSGGFGWIEGNKNEVALGGDITTSFWYQSGKSAQIIAETLVGYVNNNVVRGYLPDDEKFAVLNGGSAADMTAEAVDIVKNISALEEIRVEYTNGEIKTVAVNKDAWKFNFEYDVNAYYKGVRGNAVASYNYVNADGTVAEKHINIPIEVTPYVVEGLAVAAVPYNIYDDFTKENLLDEVFMVTLRESPVRTTEKECNRADIKLYNSYDAQGNPLYDELVLPSTVGVTSASTIKISAEFGKEGLAKQVFTIKVQLSSKKVDDVYIAVNRTDKATDIQTVIVAYPDGSRDELDIVAGAGRAEFDALDFSNGGIFDVDLVIGKNGRPANFNQKVHANVRVLRNLQSGNAATAAVVGKIETVAASAAADPTAPEDPVPDVTFDGTLVFDPLYDMLYSSGNTAVEDGDVFTVKKSDNTEIEVVMVKSDKIVVDVKHDGNITTRNVAGGDYDNAFVWFAEVDVGGKPNLAAQHIAQVTRLIVVDRVIAKDTVKFAVDPTFNPYIYQPDPAAPDYSFGKWSETDVTFADGTKERVSVYWNKIDVLYTAAETKEFTAVAYYGATAGVSRNVPCSITSVVVTRFEKYITGADGALMKTMIENQGVNAKPFRVYPYNYADGSYNSFYDARLLENYPTEVTIPEYYTVKEQDGYVKKDLTLNLFWNLASLKYNYNSETAPVEVSIGNERGGYQTITVSIPITPFVLPDEWETTATAVKALQDATIDPFTYNVSNDTLFTNVTDMKKIGIIGNITHREKGGDVQILEQIAMNNVDVKWNIEKASGYEGGVIESTAVFFEHEPAGRQTRKIRIKFIEREIDAVYGGDKLMIDYTRTINVYDKNVTLQPTVSVIYHNITADTYEKKDYTIDDGSLKWGESNFRPTANGGNCTVDCHIVDNGMTYNVPITFEVDIVKASEIVQWGTENTVTGSITDGVIDQEWIIDPITAKRTQHIPSRQNVNVKFDKYDYGTSIVGTWSTGAETFVIKDDGTVTYTTSAGETTGTWQQKTDGTYIYTIGATDGEFEFEDYRDTYVFDKGTSGGISGVFTRNMYSVISRGTYTFDEAAAKYSLTYGGGGATFAADFDTAATDYVRTDTADAVIWSKVKSINNVMRISGLGKSKMFSKSASDVSKGTTTLSFASVRLTMPAGYKVSFEGGDYIANVKLGDGEEIDLKVKVLDRTFTYTAPNIPTTVAGTNAVNLPHTVRVNFNNTYPGYANPQTLPVYWEIKKKSIGSSSSIKTTYVYDDNNNHSTVQVSYDNHQIDLQRVINYNTQSERYESWFVVGKNTDNNKTTNINEGFNGSCVYTINGYFGRIMDDDGTTILVDSYSAENSVLQNNKKTYTVNVGNYSNSITPSVLNGVWLSEDGTYTLLAFDLAVDTNRTMRCVSGYSAGGTTPLNQQWEPKKAEGTYAADSASFKLGDNTYSVTVNGDGTIDVTIAIDKQGDLSPMENGGTPVKFRKI